MYICDNVQKMTLENQSINCLFFRLHPSLVIYSIMGIKENKRIITVTTHESNKCIVIASPLNS